eukprot:jgi/Bigna1/75750/fgenesh1_pg.37_\
MSCHTLDLNLQTVESGLHCPPMATCVAALACPSNPMPPSPNQELGPRAMPACWHVGGPASRLWDCLNAIQVSGTFAQFRAGTCETKELRAKICNLTPSSSICPLCDAGVVQATLSPVSPACSSLFDAPDSVKTGVFLGAPSVVPNVDLRVDVTVRKFLLRMDALRRRHLAAICDAFNVQFVPICMNPASLLASNHFAHPSIPASMSNAAVLRSVNPWIPHCCSFHGHALSFVNTAGLEHAGTSILVPHRDRDITNDNERGLSSFRTSKLLQVQPSPSHVLVLNCVRTFQGHSKLASLKLHVWIWARLAS